MYTLVIAFHVLVCALVILVVLMQSGKGAGFSGLFGGGGGDALFSAPSGSSFMRKVTTGMAAAFFLTSLTLTYLAARRGLRTVTRGAWNQGIPSPAGAQPGAIPLPPATQPQPAQPAARQPVPPPVPGDRK